MGTWGEPLTSLELRVTKRLLPLIPGGLVVEQVLPEPDRVTVVARSRLPTVACPDCRASSSRVHSRYERHLADLPWQGRPVAIRDRKSTRLNSSHVRISYAVFFLKKKYWRKGCAGGEHVHAKALSIVGVHVCR